MKIEIDIDEKLGRLLKDMSIVSGMSVSEIIIDLILKAINKESVDDI